MSGPRAPQAVLFACNFNRVRSPMAAALMRSLYGDSIFIDSCGLHPDEGRDAMMLQVMAEAGADLSDHAAKSIDQLEPGAFDLIVSFTPQAHEAALSAARAAAIQVEYWPLADPTQAEGSREAMLDAYRQARDTLRAALIARFGPAR